MRIAAVLALVVASSLVGSIPAAGQDVGGAQASRTTVPAPPPRVMQPLRTPSPAASPRSVSEREAEEHLQRVLEREGATSATCTKKQYGSSWVTVCE
jgi:hypothetical protein